MFIMTFFFDESHLFFLSFPFLKSLFFEGREVSVNEDRRKEGGKEGGNKSHSRTFYPTILAISITNCFFCFRRRSHSQKGSAPTHQRPEANFEEKKEEKESDTRCHSRAPRVAASGGGGDPRQDRAEEGGLKGAFRRRLASSVHDY